MRVALLAMHFSEYASRLAIGLAADNDVMLVLNAANVRAELTEELRAQLESSVEAHFLELRRWRDPRVLATSLRMNELLEQFSPDVIHLQEMHPLLGGWTILSNRRRIPVITTVHDPTFHSGEATDTDWRRAILFWFRSRAARLIVHGPHGKARLETLCASLRGRVDVVPHGLLACTDANADFSTCEPGTFLFFGRIHAYKGLQYCLDAGSILQSRGRDFRLVIAGTGDDLERHRRKIEAAPWAELIDRYIEPDELPALIRRAAAVVLPYTDATQSGVGAMGFAHARPLIASRVGDLPSVVVHERTGLVVPPRDPAALADAMDRLILDRGLQETLGKGALKFARTQLNWSRIADLTCEVYRRACREQEPVRSAA